MPIKYEADEISCVLKLEEDVDINSSIELKQILLEIIASGKELHLDLRAAPYLDITAIQLLWAARHETESRGVRFTTVGGVPENITSALLEAGFDPFLISLETHPGGTAGSLKRQ